MNYEQALAFWMAHINYEQRAPERGELKLDRMRGLLARLGNPHHTLRVLHVAGSKGKGSTSAMLAALLQQAGYRTGLFTSPHLCRLEERFVVNSQPIQPDELAAIFTDLAAVIRSTKEEGPPTFFELATAAGFLHFIRRRVDVAVLEVGLGGRLDSTNVCRPTLAIITSISHDHTRILGDRLASIAREKAGIVKPRRPVISGATVPEARAVIEAVCRQRQAPLLQLERDFSFSYRPGRVQDSTEGTDRGKVQVLTPHRRWPEMELNLLGAHQAANAAVVVASVEELRRQGWHIPDEAVATGLSSVKWPARLEVVGTRPWVVLDCAHNIASAHAVTQTLESSFAATGRRLLIFASSNDKDVLGMFRVLAPHFAHAWLTRYTNNPRAVSPEQLADLWRSAGGGPWTVCPEPADAYHRAREEAQPEDLVCVTGSLFLAGQLRPLLVGVG